MLDKLIFYNHFGAGDIFESREFVKDWMELGTANEYLYAHGKHPSIIRDIDGLGYTEVTPEMDPRKPFIMHDSTLMVNTWIGRDSKYVLPGIGCVVEMNYKMFNDMRKSIGLSTLKKPIIDYITDVDYSRYNVENAKLFLEASSGVRKVLVCNGPVQSSQAENFDFNPVMDTLSNAYPEILFILTQPTGLHEKENVAYTGDIIKSPHPFDLNEVSFISCYCDVLIGRKSGPHVFSQVKRNWMDPTKKILSFTYTQIASTNVLEQPVKMKKYWSPSTDYTGVLNKIRSVLDE